jgi:hypothetical protein
VFLEPETLPVTGAGRIGKAPRNTRISSRGTCGGSMCLKFSDGYLSRALC